jgi:hypothetical protein
VITWSKSDFVAAITAAPPVSQSGDDLFYSAARLLRVAAFSFSKSAGESFGRSMERQRRRLRSIDLQNRGFHSGMRMQPAPIIRLII